MDISTSTARGLPAGETLGTLARRLFTGAERYAAPVVDLALRIAVGAAFFQSGLTKLASWDSTLALFENEYSVPLLPPQVAAYLGTFTELFMPVLLISGLAGRGAAAVLFVFNIVAAMSYPDISPAGLVQHQMWGWMLLVTLVHGPGRLSIDHFIRRRWLGAA